MSEIKIIKTQFFRFAVVGAFSTIINYSVFILLLDYAKVNYLLASAIGFFAGVLCGYFFNRSWTYQSTTKAKSEIFKYYLVYLISLCISLVFLKIVVEEIHFDKKLANLISIGITTITNFLGTKFWVFKK